MGHGGARVGAGRPPKPREGGVVLQMDTAARREALDHPPASEASRPLSEEVKSSVYTDLAEPPADLTEGQAAFWRQYAGHAIDVGTLVPATVGGFRELCEQFALKQAIATRIEKVKPTSKRAEAHLRIYVRLAQRVDASLARFKLTSFGKPAEGSTGGRIIKAPTNPWAALGGGGT